MTTPRLLHTTGGPLLTALLLLTGYASAQPPPLTLTLLCEGLADPNGLVIGGGGVLYGTTIAAEALAKRSRCPRRCLQACLGLTLCSTVSRAPTAPFPPAFWRLAGAGCCTASRTSAEAATATPRVVAWCTR